tara:strand:- start:15285 stop:16310 length:1026 start_codon:yes stop_codon:yes gene_type:complete
MTSKGQNTILTLAEKYGLQEGKGEDFYQCHSTWCITKSGAEKIKAAEGIKHSFPVKSHNPNGSSVAYMATFTSKDGSEEHEIGSCRTDGAANNPAKTHSHEMAMKRMKVRGILALVAPAGQVYGIEELTEEYRQHGNQANAPAAPQQAPQPAVQQYQAQPQQAAHLAPQNAPQQASAGGFEIPPPGSKGWVQHGEELPTDWANLMGVMCEVTGEDRSKHERSVYDHITQWQKPDGGLYLPSARFSTFSEYAMGFKEWEGVRKYNAYSALQALKRAKELVSVLQSNGSVECSQSNGNGGMQLYTIYTKENNPAFRAGASAEVVKEYGAEAVTASKSDVDVPF